MDVNMKIEQIEEILKALGSHYTIMKFDSNYRICIGQPVSDWALDKEGEIIFDVEDDQIEACYPKSIQHMPDGKTLTEAFIKFLFVYAIELGEKSGT